MDAAWTGMTGVAFGSVVSLLSGFGLAVYQSRREAEQARRDRQ